MASKTSVLVKAVILAAFLIFVGIYAVGLREIKSSPPQGRGPSPSDAVALRDEVLPPGGVVLPAKWGGLGWQMVEAGVIDEQKFRNIYARRGGLDEEAERLLTGSGNGNLRITRENAGVILNLLWGLGLANKNPILEKGPMASAEYGDDPSRFASTGGWTLARGDTMAHYSAHEFTRLTSEQQALVEKVSQGIYRPCCNNPTYFPDCNHGMAMLGFLELMASQGASEEEMYRAALAVNSYWFPDTYLTIAKYFESQGMPWANVQPNVVLGPEFSSYSGYENVLAQVGPVQFESGGGCGV